MVDRSRLLPELKRFLDALDLLPFVDIFTVAPVDERAASETRLRELWGEKQPVDQIEELSYRSGGQAIRARLYRPNGADRTILFIHGGGWQGGNKSGPIRNQLVPFAASGKYLCVSIGYRLSGEATWPAQIHDCKAAIRWLRAHADKYHLNPDKIGVWGGSASSRMRCLCRIVAASAARINVTSSAAPEPMMKLMAESPCQPGACARTKGPTGGAGAGPTAWPAHGVAGRNRGRQHRGRLSVCLVCPRNGREDPQALGSVGRARAATDRHVRDREGWKREREPYQDSRIVGKPRV